MIRLPKSSRAVSSSPVRVRTIFAGLAACCLAMLFTVSTVLAETYYVRIDGIDTNTGLANTADSAFQTIQHASDIAVAGDVIMISAGSYAGVGISRVGTPENPITYQGIGDVYVAGVSFASAPYINSPWPANIAYYTVLDNLKFIGEMPGVRAGTGIGFRGVSQIAVKNCLFQGLANGLVFDRNYYTNNYNLTFSNCLFQDNANGGTVTGGQGGLQSSVFENCRFTGNDVGFNVPGYGMEYSTFSRCTFDNNRIGAVIDGCYWYFLKSHNNALTRCIFRNNTIGLVIGAESLWLYPNGSSWDGVSYANQVNNSVFYANTDSGIRVNTNFSGVNDGSPAYYDSMGQTITNNIFLNNTNYGIDNTANQTLFVNYNLAFGNGLAPGRNAEFDMANYSLLVDPKLVDPTNNDFNLQPGSPCIDAGNPVYDAEPLRYGAHIDIGAFEYVDQTAPVTTTALSGTSGSGSWYVGDIDVTLSASDVSGVREVRYSIDGEAEVVVAGAAASLTVTTEGYHTLTYYAVDVFDNTEVSKSLQFAIDKSMPTAAATVTGNAGTNGWFRSAVTIALTAADATSGVKEIRYSVNGGSEVVVAGASATVSLPANVVSTVNYRTFDNAGNQSAVNTQTVSSDTTAPTVTVRVSTRTIHESDRLQSVTISGSANDSLSGIASTSIKVTDRQGKTVATAVGFGSTVQLRGVEDQVYTVTATSIDNAGNSASARTTITVEDD